MWTIAPACIAYLHSSGGGDTSDTHDISDDSQDAQDPRGVDDFVVCTQGHSVNGRITGGFPWTAAITKCQPCSQRYGPPQNAVSLRRMYVKCMLNVCKIHTSIPSTYLQHTFNIHSTYIQHTCAAGLLHFEGVHCTSFSQQT